MTQSQQRQARLINEMKRRAQFLPLTTAYSHEGTFLSAIGIKTAGKQAFARGGRSLCHWSRHRHCGRQGNQNQLQATISGCRCVDYSSHPLYPHVESPEFSFELVNSDRFLNIQSVAVRAVDTNKVEGLLGHTANPEWQVSKKRSFREHMVMDYLIQGDLFDDDFVANRYNDANDNGQFK